MSRHKFLIFMCLVLAVAVFAWSSGDALAQAKDTKDPAKEQVTKEVAAKGKVTTSDVATYLGKIPPAEQKAAAERAKQLGLKPGVAGLPAQAPAPGGTR